VHQASLVSLHGARHSVHPAAHLALRRLVSRKAVRGALARGLLRLPSAQGRPSMRARRLSVRAHGQQRRHPIATMRFLRCQAPSGKAWQRCSGSRLSSSSRSSSSCTLLRRQGRSQTRRRCHRKSPRRHRARARKHQSTHWSSRSCARASASSSRCHARGRRHGRQSECLRRSAYSRASRLLPPASLPTAQGVRKGRTKASRASPRRSRAHHLPPLHALSPQRACYLVFSNTSKLHVSCAAPGPDHVVKLVCYASHRCAL
jgi:hypothetical protein